MCSVESLEFTVAQFVWPFGVFSSIKFKSKIPLNESIIYVNPQKLSAMNSDHVLSLTCTLIYLQFFGGHYNVVTLRYFLITLRIISASVRAYYM